MTRRQVERHYNVIATAFDSHGIDSWGTRRRVYHSDGAMTFNSTDPDAACRANSNDNPWKRPVFGYDLTMASARDFVKSSARQQGVLGDVLMDREYTMKHDGTHLMLTV